MKKGTSFYLEEDILEEIETYRIDNGLKSKNTALERLILEYKTLKKELEYTKVLADYAKNIMSGGQFTPSNIQPNNIKNENQNQNKNSNKNTNPILRRSIQNSYDNIE